MLRSEIFTNGINKQIEVNVLSFLNSNKKMMNKRSLDSPRAVGDAVQNILEENFAECVPEGIIKDFNSSFARRSMADFAFTDCNGFYHVIDNKTHNLGTQFNMPNLTSVERLSRFYQDDKNYFDLLFIAYKAEDGELLFDECHFEPIEHFEWSCLTLGALGWGQIQIANSNILKIDNKITRRKWMLDLCSALEIFYPREIEKITDRIEHFKNIREYWEAHEDI